MVSDLNTKMWFGKYKGQTIGSILEANPGYLLWAHQNTNIFRMTEELVDRAEILKEEIQSWTTQDGRDSELDNARRIHGFRPRVPGCV